MQSRELMEINPSAGETKTFFAQCSADTTVVFTVSQGENCSAPPFFYRDIRESHLLAFCRYSSANFSSNRHDQCDVSHRKKCRENYQAVIAAPPIMALFLRPLSNLCGTKKGDVDRNCTQVSVGPSQLSDPEPSRCSPTHTHARAGSSRTRGRACVFPERGN